MNQFTLEDLRQILGTVAGPDEAANLHGDIADAELGDLGFDSLAMLELAGQVQRRYGVPIPDEAIGEMTTARRTVEYVNAQLARAAA